MTRWAIAALAVALGVAACGSSDTIGGVVQDADGPIGGAVVRIQTTDNAVVTDEQGTFTLDAAGLARVSAWAEGYYIGGGEEHEPGAEVEIELVPLPTEDDPTYQWISAVDASGEHDPCAECHSAAGTSLEVNLPVDDWLRDPHSGSATNPRFLTMYSGTDLAGNQSPPTRYVERRDYGRIPVRPDPDEPYYGPGYKLDFPDTDGNCSSCHVPTAAIDDPYGVDPRQVSGVFAEGVTCDFCHKVSEIRLDAAGTLGANMTGVLSYRFLRPSEGHQFFAGPLDDVAPGEDAYLPLYQEGAYCAGCHSAAFWDTLIYDSYDQWLASPYSDPVSGQSCQDCHMQPNGADVFVLPDQGGLIRDPATLPGHDMTVDAELLREAVTMTVDAVIGPNGVEATVTIVNDGTGHSVPTDSPLRQMVLLVAATGADGSELPLLSGSVVPDWIGPEAGLPGAGYAKVLEELWTEVSPTGAYWNPTRIVTDTRIPALGSSETAYVFTAPADGGATVQATLLYRRAFRELMDQKGWTVPDIVMAQQTMVLPAG